VTRRAFFGAPEAGCVAAETTWPGDRYGRSPKLGRRARESFCFGWNGSPDSGIVSLVVPMPRNEQEGFKTVAYRGCGNPREKKVSPFVSAIVSWAE